MNSGLASILFVQNIAFELIGIMSISSFLKQRGHRVDLIIETDPGKTVRYVEANRPDIIAFSTVAGQHTTALKIAAALKRRFKDIPIVIGGPYPTFFPNIIDQEPIDFVCRGEGEEAMADILERLDQGAGMSDIPNLWVKEGGKITRNDVRPIIEDLDSLPFPDRSLYDKYPYFKSNPVRRFMSGRGCPYGCNFCFNHSLRKLYSGKGRLVRMRSGQNVLEEIRQVADRYPAMKRVKFEDDTFTLNRNWALNFLKEYKKRIRMPLACYSRADRIDDELVRALQEAGCDRLNFGLESGNEKIRNEILNKKLTDEQIIKAAEILRAHGVPFGTMSMFGLPGETFEDALATIRLNIKIKPNDVWGSVFQPYPGTECGRYAVENGYCKNLDLDRIRSDYQTNSLLEQPDIRKVVNLHKFFYLLVMVPGSMRFVRPLLALPPNIFFLFIHRILYFIGYATRTKGGIVQILRDIRMASKYK